MRDRGRQLHFDVARPQRNEQSFVGAAAKHASRHLVSIAAYISSAAFQSFVQFAVGEGPLANPEFCVAAVPLAQHHYKSKRAAANIGHHPSISYFLNTYLANTLISLIHMAEIDATTKRAVGLTKLFNSVIRGNRELKNAADGDRFLEAFCAQEDVSKCVEVLIAAPAGLGAVARAFRFSNSSINGHAASALLQLSDPSLKALYGGQFLQRIIEAIVDPPSFWHALVDSHDARALTLEASHAFAWLLLELLISRSEDVPDVRTVAERVTKNASLINSDSLEVRNLGHKIKHVLSSTSDVVDGPGGRHDNDHANFRDVKILPTQDEFASTTAPFYRRAADVESADVEERGLLHIDN